jgi:hypothetical protein
LVSDGGASDQGHGPGTGLDGQLSQRRSDHDGKAVKEIVRRVAAENAKRLIDILA